MSTTLRVANGDLELNAAGLGELISGRAKTSQDYAEILLSDYDAERGYGGKLHSMVVPGLGAKAILSAEIQRITNRLISMQSSDPNTDSSERIVSAQEIRVSVDKQEAQFQSELRTADAGSLTLADNVRLKPIQLAHTWPGGQMPFV